MDPNPPQAAIPLPPAPAPVPPLPPLNPLQRKRVANDVAASPNASSSVSSPSPAKKPNLSSENNFNAFQVGQNSSPAATTTAANIPTSSAVAVKSEPYSDAIPMDDDDDDDDVIWEEVDAATSWAAIGQQVRWGRLH